jgi:diamine N-acetyltransferase
MARVKLMDVTVDNWEEVCELELDPEQAHLVASNAYSIAESKFNPYCHPRAIYAGKKLVGFLMYESLEEDNEPHDYSIYRFMIDRRHQGKGYGRQAFKQALKEIGNDPELDTVYVCYLPDNEVSRRLYASFGFEETGLDDDGEMIAELCFD